MTTPEDLLKKKRAPTIATRPLISSKGPVTTAKELSSTRTPLVKEPAKPTKAPKIVLSPGPPVRSNVRVTKKPVRLAIAKPAYHTQESDPSMGWQERVSRNKDLDATYREKLRLRSQGDISTRSTRAGLTQSRLGRESAEGLRGDIEKGLGSRQALQLQHESGAQQARYEEQKKSRVHDIDLTRVKQKYEASREASRVGSAKEAQRSTDALSLLREGRFKSKQDFEGYMEGGSSSVQGLRISPAQDPKKYERIAPRFEKTLERGGQEVVTQVSPGGYFDPATGESKYDLTKMTDQEKDSMLDELLKLK